MQVLGRGAISDQSMSKATDTADVIGEGNSIALDFGAGHVLGLVQP